MVWRKRVDLELLPVALDHAGAVHQRVDARAGRDQRRYLRVTGDVELDMADGVMSRRGCDLSLREAGGDHFISRLRQGQGRSRANAPRAAGDDCKFHRSIASL